MFALVGWFVGGYQKRGLTLCVVGGQAANNAATRKGFDPFSDTLSNHERTRAFAPAELLVRAMRLPSDRSHQTPPFRAAKLQKYRPLVTARY